MSNVVDFEDIAASDPLSVLLELDKRLRPVLVNDETVDQYMQKMDHAAAALGVPIEYKNDYSKGKTYDEIMAAYASIRVALDKKRIDLVAARVSKSDGVALDETWRTKIHSHLAQVRGIVDKADVAVEIRDSIIARLHDLDREVDRQRSRVTKFSDAIVSLCEGISSGAEALKPAVVVIERIIGALARLKRSEERNSAQSLPPPDKLGLPDYSNKTDPESGKSQQ